MSGDAEQLSEDNSKVFEGGGKLDLVRDVSRWLLEHQ